MLLKGLTSYSFPTAAQQLLTTVSPAVIASGSNKHFNVSCGAKNEQPLYNAEYQFYLNGMPINAPSNSSLIMDRTTSTSNFTCSVTQYTDLKTPIPSQQSPPVQAVVLSELVMAKAYLTLIY